MSNFTQKISLFLKQDLNVTESSFCFKKTHNTSKKTVRYDIHEKFSENKSQQPNKQNCMWIYCIFTLVGKRSETCESTMIKNRVFSFVII